MGKKNPIKRRAPIVRVLRFILFLHLGYWGVIAALSLLYSFVNPPVTPLMIQRYLIRGYDWHKRYYVPLENIPSSTQKMVIALEDGNFYKHWGFEFPEIKKCGAFNSIEPTHRLKTGAKKRVMKFTSRSKEHYIEEGQVTTGCKQEQKKDHKRKTEHEDLREKIRLGFHRLR